jgi:TRAP-type C4-dicarboxylate transport system permease small subunit
LPVSANGATELENPDQPVQEGIVERTARVLAWISGGLMLGCAFLITLDVFSREFFNDNYFESFEITIYTYAVTVAFSFAFALTTKTHIRIDILYARVPPLGRALLDILSISLLSLIAIIFSYYAWSTTATSFSYPGPSWMGAASASDLSVPLVIPQSIWSLGLTWFAAVCLIYLYRAVMALVRNDLSSIESLIGIELSDAETAAEVEEIMQASADRGRNAPPGGNA